MKKDPMKGYLFTRIAIITLFGMFIGLATKNAAWGCAGAFGLLFLETKVH